MSGIGTRWDWFLAIAVGGAILTSANCAFAQITPDGTLPNNSRVTTQGNISTIEGGTRAGGNLFHSFSEFSILTGSSAHFNNAADIQNIISRVTGTSVSHIDGLIRANGTANLFLLNPNGIILGPNARLDIGGSFVGSTASSMIFADNTQFSATAPQTTPLLTISVPLGLQFGPTAGTIENKSRATNSSDGIGLQVNPGKTLALVGGDVNLEGATMLAPGGRVELGAVSSSGTVGLTVDSNNLSLSFPSSIARADVKLTDGSFVGVAAGGGGSIAINARNIDVLGGSYLSAGIESSSEAAVAGDITLNATEKIAVKQSSNIINEVSPNTTGNSGNININAASLDLENAILSASTFGKGNGGSVFVQAKDSVSLANSYIYSDVESGGVGKGGDINITTGTLSLTNGAQLSASTFGQGNAGSVNINARDTVSFDGAIAFSDVEPGGVGKGGDINITTGTLSLTKGAQLYASTFGQGNAGSVNINARDTVTFDGAFAFSSVESGGVGNGGDINITATAGSLSLSNGAGLIARIQGKGDGGKININANQLTLSSDALIEGDLDLTGKGRGADINLNVTGQILLTGSERQQGESTRITLGALPGAIGSAGNLTIHAGSLVLKDGGFIKNSSQAQDGSAGKIEVYADQVNISGTGSSSGLSSGLFTSTTGSKNAGNITINTSTFYIADGAALSARTTGNGQGGDIMVNASRSFEAVNGGQLVTTTSGNGNAGSIFVNAKKERVTISGTDPNYDNRIAKFPISVNSLVANDIKEGSASALLANAETNSTGTAGNVTINTGMLQVYDQAGVFVQSLGSGNAGNLAVNSRSIRLDNGTLSANTPSNSTDPNKEQATITLHSGDLILTHGSKITTNATGSKVIGGNINIDTDVLAAVQNSHIQANSNDFQGGRVFINAQGVFLSSDSDITAIGKTPQLNGTVQINTPDVDPSRGLVQLPTTITENTPRLLASSCAAFDTGGSSFTVTGRGGLPPSPDEPLTNDVIWTDTRIPSTTQQHSSNKPSAKPHSKPKAEPIVIAPAIGWVFNGKGEVTLISSAPNTSVVTSPSTCRAGIKMR